MMKQYFDVFCWIAWSRIIILGTLATVLDPTLQAQTQSKDKTIYTTDPVLKELMSKVRFWVNFDESPEPVIGMPNSGADKTIPVGKEYLDAPGIVGKAFLSKDDCKCYYPATENLDFSKPGALSFWLAPSEWSRDRSSDRDVESPYLTFFTTVYKPNGYLGINRQIFWRKGGVIQRQDELYLFAAFFPDIRPNVGSSALLKFGSTVEGWEDGKWHFIVLNWKGSLFEISLDGTLPRPLEIGRTLGADEVKRFFLGGLSRETTSGKSEATLYDEFMTYSNPLDQKEIEGSYRVLRP